MRILFITGEYAPHTDANGNCVRSLAGAFIQMGHSVSVLAAKKSLSREKITHWEGATLYWYDARGSLSKAEGIKYLKNHPVRGVIQGIRMVATRLSRARQKAFHSSRRETKQVLTALRPLLKKQRFDVVVPVFNPVFSSQACARLVQQGEMPYPFYIYQLDEFIDNAVLSPNHREARLIATQELYGVAKSVFITPLMEKALTRQAPALLEGCTSLEFPNLVPHPAARAPENILVPGKINCVFLGVLIEDLRNPTYLLRLMQAMGPQVHLHIAGEGCASLLTEWKERLSDRLHLHGTLPIESCHGLMREAQVLVNIGNRMTNMLPSKIFDYFSAGRPILNLVYSDQCPTLPYLNKYPHALSLQQGQEPTEEAIRQVGNFAAEAATLPSIPFARVAEIFVESTPRYVAEKMLRKMGRGE